MTRSPVVVVGVDGSPGSKSAIRWAVEQATLTGATLLAVSSWRWPNYITRVPPGIDLDKDTKRTLDDMLDQVFSGSEDVTVTRHVVEGPPGPVLVAQSHDASLLVVGAQGRGVFKGMLLGSVAEYCVRHGTCPVVVVRP